MALIVCFYYLFIDFPFLSFDNCNLIATLMKFFLFIFLTLSRSCMF